MKFEVTILGSSSATPIYQRHPTAQVLQVQERFFLIDCGEGTLIQMNRYKIRFHRIDHIFISHLHGDHYLGLMGLISTMHLQGRTNELHVYSQPELKEIIDIQLRYSDTRLRYPLVFHDLDPSKPSVIYQDDLIEVKTIILNHRIPCTGFLFAERPRPRKLVKELLAEYQVPLEAYLPLKEGRDVTLPDGRVLLNSEMTNDPAPSRSYAFCSDTMFEPSVAEAVKGVDLLYHEATFLEDKLERARETFHSTAGQAAQVAVMAKAKRLIIGHFSARYKNLYPLLDEAKAVFENTTLALEGDRFSID